MYLKKKKKDKMSKIVFSFFSVYVSWYFVLIFPRIFLTALFPSHAVFCVFVAFNFFLGGLFFFCPQSFILKYLYYLIPDISIESVGWAVLSLSPL